MPVSLRPGYEGGGALRSPDSFVLTDLEAGRCSRAASASSDVAAARRAVRERTFAALFGLTALFVAWLAVPLLAWRRAARTHEALLVRSALLAGLVVAARIVAWAAVPLAGAVAPLNGVQPVAWSAQWWLRSPIDFLLTSASCLALVILASDLVTRLRVGLRAMRVSPAGTLRGSAAFGLTHAGRRRVGGRTARVVFRARVLPVRDNRH